jgi:hypothetical protein
MDQHATTQRRLEALTDAFADSFFDRYLVCFSRLRHRVCEISRELDRKPRRLCVAHSECSLAWRLPIGGLELNDRQWPTCDFWGASPRSASLVSGVCQEISLAFCWLTIGAHWYVLVVIGLVGKEDSQTRLD